MSLVSNAAAEPRNLFQDFGSKRKPTVSDEERRLSKDFRQVDTRDDPDAVLISKPGTNTIRTGMGRPNVIPGGPQPRNTLRNPYISRSPPQNKRASARDSTRTNKGLPLQTIVGDNVPSANRSSAAPAAFDNPPAKRQKIEQVPEEQSSSQITGSDEADPLALDDELVPSLAKRTQRTSQTTSALGLPRERPKVGFVRVQEYHNVENRMRSQRSKNRRSQRSTSRNKDAIQLDLSEVQADQAQAGSTLIDISDDEPEAVVISPPRYKGTAHEAHKSFLVANKSPAGRMKDTGERSRHFASKQRRITESNPAVEVPTNSTQNHIEHRESRLNDQFIATNGKRKSHDLLSSPDALQGGITVGRNRDDTDVKFAAKPGSSRQASPSKSSSSTRKGSPTKSDHLRLSPSRIQTSTFTNVKAKATNSKVHCQKDLVQEAEPGWGIQLAAVNLGGQTLKTPSLGLQYNDKTESFDVINNSKSLAKDDLSFRIQLAKLRKVLWSIDGVEVRFESARSEGVDPLLDVTLNKESEVPILLAKLQEKYSLRVIGKDREKLKKMFENRLAEHRIAYAAKLNPAVDEGEELQLKVKRKAQRDNEQGLEVPDGISIKRRRTNARIIDRIRDKDRDTAVDDNPQDAQPDFEGQAQMRSRTATGDGKTEQRLQQDTLGLRSLSPSKIPTLLDNLKSKPQDTYTTRSRTERKLGPAKAPASILDDPPPIRYTQVKDLGNPWSKPLTYPKIGKKKATVEWADLERLDEGEFLNDNLIAFYLRYLEQQLEERKPDVARKVYFFNTFFYTSLTNHGKSHRNINYELVKKWTRKDDIFLYDYVVVPINEAYHWYVAVICNLPALKRSPASHDDEGHRSGSTEDDSTSHNHAAEKGEGFPAEQAAADQQEPPTEQETRRSFAEMSLECESPPAIRHNEPRSIEAPKQVADDQDMLETQIIGDPADANEQLKEEAPVAVRNEEAGQGTATEQEMTPIPAGNNRKGKRKSIPPGKKLHPSEPAIITFDSLPQTHPATVRALKDYLLAEAECKRSMQLDEKQLRGMTAVGIPKQDNFCDCGPFLLGYMDKFMEDPEEFMSKAMQKQFDPENDWPSLVPSKLRANIRDLILGLNQEQQDERRESAKRTGKYHPRTSEATSRAASSGPATRTEALKSALPDGRPAPEKASKSRSRSPEQAHIDPSLLNPSSAVVADSQSQRDPKVSNHCHSPPTAELPSTIPDSQPGEPLQRLEEEIPASLPAAPLEPKTAAPEPVPTSPPEPKKRDGKEIDPLARTRMLRSSPRQAKNNRKERATEVVDLLDD